MSEQENFNVQVKMPPHLVEKAKKEMANQYHVKWKWTWLGPRRVKVKVKNWNELMEECTEAYLSEELAPPKPRSLWSRMWGK